MVLLIPLPTKTRDKTCPRNKISNAKSYKNFQPSYKPLIYIQVLFLALNAKYTFPIPNSCSKRITQEKNSRTLLIVIIPTPICPCTRNLVTVHPSIIIIIMYFHRNENRQWQNDEENQRQYRGNNDLSPTVSRV